MTKKNQTAGLSRRDFMRRSLAGTLALTGAAALNPLSLVSGKASAAPGDFSLPMGTLGDTGITTTILGFGTGTNGYNGHSNQTGLGFSNLVSLLEYGYSKGIKFFDLAHQYGSHPHMGAALEHNGGSIPREEVVIQTKINLDQNWMNMVKDMNIGWDGGTKAEWAQWVIDEALSTMNIDMIDMVFMHHMGLGDWTGDWPSNPDFGPVRDVLDANKSAGKIRAVGNSQHEFDALQAAANLDWGDVNMARLNPWGGWAGTNRSLMDNSPDLVVPEIKKMKDKGRGIVGMKIFNMANVYGPIDGDDGETHVGFTTDDKEDLLAHATDTSLYGEDYAGLLDVFSIGFESETQIDETIDILAALLTPDTRVDDWVSFR